MQHISSFMRYPTALLADLAATGRPRSLASGEGQVFFHQSEAPAGGVALGDALSFRVRADARSGKPVAVALRRLDPSELEPELRMPGGLVAPPISSHRHHTGTGFLDNLALKPHMPGGQ